MPFKNIEDKRKYQREYQTKLRRKKGVKEKTLMSEDKRKEHQRAASKRYYYNNIELERERKREWKKANPEKQRFMEKRRRGRVKNAKGSHTLKEWGKLKEQYGNMCVFCQSKGKLTQDHIIPLSKKGTDYIDNIQPLCFSCNASKQDKIINRMETDLLRFENGGILAQSISRWMG